MEAILAHAHNLMYTLLALMPSHYQCDSLEALLGLFLESFKASHYHITAKINQKVL
jgi:hypothetical protein